MKSIAQLGRSPAIEKLDAAMAVVDRAIRAAMTPLEDPDDVLGRLDRICSQCRQADCRCGPH